MILKLSLDLPEEIEYIRLTRVLGKSTLECMNVILTDIEDVETILSELTSNVVRHAHSIDGRYGLVLEYYATKLVIIVKDKGRGFSAADESKKPEERKGLHGEVRLGGYGLKIVQGLSDRLQFTQSDRNGTTVRAVKLLSYNSSDDAAFANKLNAGPCASPLTVSI
ncbi:MAG: ATP-binding protein [Capsulimonas sp.]|uniref:ATP-binding protein n=1 Tax=Capsulimonas sp. TaxID=2494211 RepID=UPI0032678F46